MSHAEDVLKMISLAVLLVLYLSVDGCTLTFL